MDNRGTIAVVRLRPLSGEMPFPNRCILPIAATAAKARIRNWLRSIDAGDAPRYRSRRQRHMMQDIKQRVALSSIAASAGLTVAKAIVGVTSGSLAILSEAAHSLIDLGATVMTYFAVRVSGKPADAEHHYGHGKVESVSALAETALLFGLAGVVIWEAAKRLIERRAAAGRGDGLGIRGDAALDRRRLLPSPRALPDCPTDVERGAGSRRASFLFRYVVVAGRRGRAGRHHARLCAGRLGGSDSCIGRHLHCGLAARPTHHRYADGYRPGRRRRQNHRRRDPHSQRGRRSNGCACARSVKCCSSTWSLRSAARCRSIGWRRSRTVSSKPCAPKGRPPR